MPRRSRAPLPALLLPGILVALAGCALVQETYDPSLPGYPPPAEQPIAVVQIPRTLTVAGLDGDGRAQAAAFLDAYRESARGVLSVTVAGLAPRRADAAAAALRELARRRGVDPDALRIVTTAAGAPGLTLSYADFAALPPACRPETGTIVDPNNRLSPNFGCALQHDLAAMIAHPADLVSPRPADPYDAGRNARVVGNYRTGQPTGAAPGPNDSARISNVAR